MNELINILNEVKADVDFSKEKSLIDDEILSSFDIDYRRILFIDEPILFNLNYSFG